MKKMYLFSLIMVLLIAGCSGTGAVEPAASDVEVSDAPVAQDVDGTLYTTSTADFSVTLPSEWIATEATAGAFAEMRGENALSFLSDEYVQAMLASGTELYAVNGDSASLSSEAPVTLNIRRGDAPTSLTVDELVADTTNQLADIVELTSDVEKTTVMLGNDEAIQISYVMQMETAVGIDANVHNTQYYLMKDGDLYIMTLEMGQELVDTYLESSQAAAETFQITDN